MTLTHTGDRVLELSSVTDALPVTDVFRCQVRACGDQSFATHHAVSRRSTGDSKCIGAHNSIC
jgi:hypothetical protein